jgi:hypothetical protein
VSAPFRFRIGRSRIHGYGVFALEDIPVGRQVIEYAGRGLDLIQVTGRKPPKNGYLVSVSPMR